MGKQPILGQSGSNGYKNVYHILIVLKKNHKSETYCARLLQKEMLILTFK